MLAGPPPVKDMFFFLGENVLVFPPLNNTPTDKNKSSKNVRFIFVWPVFSKLERFMLYEFLSTHSGVLRLYVKLLYLVLRHSVNDSTIFHVLLGFENLLFT